MWIFVLMNMIYADILNTLKPGYLAELESVSSSMSGEVVLLFALFMEVPILMIMLSRILGRKNNRMAQFIAIPFSILWVVVPSFLSSGTPLSYVFFATVEVATMAWMFWYAWKWEAE